MRRARRETAPAAEERIGRMDGEIARIIRANTFGGTKDGRNTWREIPAIAEEKGIKFEWDNRADKYPPILRIRMTDGEWVEYHIAAPHPGFAAAMDSLKSGKWETGYPGEKHDAV